MNGLETIFWHTCHSAFLNRDSHVIDLGANYSQFSKQLTSRFGCECHAIEASPEIFEALVVNNRIHKFNFAITSKDGATDFHVRSDSTASSIHSDGSATLRTITVAAKRLDTFVSDLGWNNIDLLKMDIEGAEIEVLESCSDEFLGTIRQMSIEFHDFCGITPSSQVEKTLKRLRGLGFWIVQMSRRGHQDTWLLNRRLCHLSTLRCLGSRYWTRNGFGFKRLTSRTLKSSVKLLPGGFGRFK